MDQCARLQKAFDAAGKTVADVAAHLKITPQAVYKWLRDPNMNIRNEHLFSVADYLHYNARWLATGRGPEVPGSDTPIVTEPTPAYHVTPPSAVSAIISGIHTLLKLAGLPPDCLGHTATLQAAIKAGKPPAAYSIPLIQTATIEALTESASYLDQLSPAEVAKLITDKLTSWIDAPTSTTTEQTHS